MSLDANLRLFNSPEKFPQLQQIVRGIEKESLRVKPSGHLSDKPHPKALGSALCHPHITTDFSEALLEFITAPCSSITATMTELEDIHRITYQHIDDELLWANSMPCQLGTNESIPIGQYGRSNIGRMKTIYRRGLGHRYGRLMQTIAGIHYNFSVPDALWRELQQNSPDNTETLQDFKSAGYFGLIRNFRRYSWLLLYLLGAAPAVCRSFVNGREHHLEPFGNDDHSLHTPYATSLRMGDLGYQSDAQGALVVCYNNLQQYTETLSEALKQDYSPYKTIGLKDNENQYKQLNTSILQIENEFYSAIRPKRTTYKGETPVHALRERGVEYIEVRCVDLNPLLPCGIDEETICFLDTFLLYCLFKNSPLTDEVEYHKIPENLSRTVYSGRDKSLMLLNQDGEIPLIEWGQTLMADIGGVAELLDSANQTSAYSQAFITMQQRLEDQRLTPAATLLDEMRANNETFYAMSMRKALDHKRFFDSKEPSEETIAKYTALAEKSFADKASIEDKDDLSFDDFLTRYYNQ